MKKIILTLSFLLFLKVSFTQNHFPFNEKLVDTIGNNVPSVTFSNLGKPLMIEYFGTHCVPCINLLNSFKEVYSDWQKKYGLKIIVIVTDVKSKRSKKKLMQMIREHNWPFHFYLDSKKALYKKMTNSNVVPQTFIYDGNYNLIGKFLGVKPNYGYKIIDGKISDKKVKINNKGKYSDLECNLIEYENSLEFILEKSN